MHRAARLLVSALPATLVASALLAAAPAPTPAAAHRATAAHLR